jgi:hypothetical protein
MGRDIWTIPFGDLTQTLKVKRHSFRSTTYPMSLPNRVSQLSTQELYFAEVFYMVSETFTQLSILFFYLRVFDSTTFRRAAIGLSVFAICFGISNTFAMIFQCTPVSFFWNGWTGERAGKCININLFSWIRAAIEIIIDLTIISLPIPLLLRLKLNWLKKLQILAMFSIGFL